MTADELRDRVAEAIWAASDGYISGVPWGSAPTWRRGKVERQTDGHCGPCRSEQIGAA